MILEADRDPSMGTDLGRSAQDARKMADYYVFAAYRAAWGSWDDGAGGVWLPLPVLTPKSRWRETVLKHIQSSEARTRRDAKGFTLIELLVVVIILGILAAVAIFSVGNLTDRASENTCKTELATVKTAVQAYKANSASGTTPPNSTAQMVGGNGNLESTPKFYQVGSGGVITRTAAGLDEAGCPTP